ncbi:DUF5719 family protein [Arthrobacter sp. Helios]|uniref:DUF5719 family protein n=1 Tax=Arthrobacter sp. Helios TaxID=2828862 RepID=UPI00206BB28D|nr:DUF5719 family protein [Arthrobacter sp. Helios]UPO77588.1 DUF5719 family protein [Arthrobacter sp. Helios]
MERSGEVTRSAARGRRQSRRKTAYTVSAGVVLLAAAGALITAGAVAAPAGSGIAVQPPATEVPAGALTAVCPQPLRLLAGNVSGTDAEYSPVSESAATAVSSVVLGAAGASLPAAELSGLEDGKVLAGIKAGDTAPLAGTRLAGVLQNQAVGTVTALEAEPSGKTPATANAVLGYSATDGDLAGLAAANCQTPGNDMWLLGARTTVGATAVLRLSNPSVTPATVDLELHGSAGRIESGNSRGIVVAPGETRSIILAGLAANEEAAAVRVRSSGGPVTAVIEQSILRGLTPGGVEIIEPTAAPSPRQVITGIALQSPETLRKLAEQEGRASVASTLNVAVPGSTDAVVHLRVFGPDGEVQIPGGGVFSVPAGTVGKIPLADLPEGTYSLDLSSDVAFTAAAVFSRGTEPEERVELAVAPADTRMGSEHLAVAVPGASSSLVFTAPDGSAEVRVRAIGADGKLQEEKVVAIPAGRTLTLQSADIGSGNLAGVLVTAVGEAVYGAQLVTGEGPGISVLPLPEGSTGSRSAQIGIGY